MEIPLCSFWSPFFPWKFHSIESKETADCAIDERPLVGDKFYSGGLVGQPGLRRTMVAYIAHSLTHSLTHSLACLITSSPPFRLNMEALSTNAHLPVLSNGHMLFLFWWFTYTMHYALIKNFILINYIHFRREINKINFKTYFFLPENGLCSIV